MTLQISGEDIMTQAHSSSIQWIASTLPVKTIAGVKVVYDEQSYKSRYYSIEWLAETFDEQITSAENPRQTITKECKRRGYSELQDLFSLKKS